MNEFIDNDNAALNVGSYQLKPLLRTRQDDLVCFLGDKPGIYICDHPDRKWYEYFNFVKTQGGGSIKRTSYIFSKMANGSKWLSPTSDVPSGKSAPAFQSGNILHLACRALPFRLGQFIQTVSLFCWLWKHRKKYEYCLVYNFYLPIFLAPLAIKLLLKKRLYIDYEDDYTKQRKNKFKNSLESLLRKTVNGALCINEGMLRYFKNKPACVLNVVSNLEYLETANFSLRENMTFLFGGTLDEIRGIELVPSLIETLRTKIKKFKIIITGSGPLRPMVEKWTYPEVEYLGYLNNADYAKIIAESDACLVLQKPDHPFSLGSFPSKIDEYAEYKKPIFILE